MAQLVIIRHGESVWNQQNKFTGWVDVPLSAKGKEEAKKAGQLLKKYSFDKVFTSHLIRSIQTMQIVLEEMGEKRTPIIYHVDDKKLASKENHESKSGELEVLKSVGLAERYYGDLQGLNKDDCRKKFGEEQVHIWRRSFDIRPPGGDSLKDTLKRVMPFYDKYIVPELKKNKKILIAAHGNSLRGIVKHLEKISDKDIPNYELETGVPIVYELDKNLKVISKKILK